MIASSYDHEHGEKVRRKGSAEGRICTLKHDRHDFATCCKCCTPGVAVIRKPGDKKSSTQKPKKKSLLIKENSRKILEKHKKSEYLEPL